MKNALERAGLDGKSKAKQQKQGWMSSRPLPALLQPPHGRARPAMCAILMILAAPAVPQSDDEQPHIRVVASPEGPLLIPPESVTDVTAQGITMSVSTARGVRTYRATFDGRTRTTHVDASGPPVQLAFDRSAMRFRKLATTVRVEMADYRLLYGVAREIGAVAAKAYPHLGFARIRLPVRTDPVDAVDRLQRDPRVSRAGLLFRDPAQRPRPPQLARAHPRWRELAARLLGRANPQHGSPDGPARIMPAAGKDALSSELIVVFSGAQPASSTSLQSSVAVFNWGAVASEETNLVFAVYADPTFEDDPLRVQTHLVPALDPKDDYVLELKTDLTGLPVESTYYAVAIIQDQEGEAQTRPNYDFAGFALDAYGLVRLACAEPGRGESPGVTDPLASEQWHLSNSGQTAYAQRGGSPGEDLGMAEALADGPQGGSVRVAVVDTGLETCHPDLRAAVEQDASFNFNAVADRRMGGEISDPFNLSTMGDHGTLVAGVVAAAADNGIGGRGVSPGVRLRGYNLLSVLGDPSDAQLDALGASAWAPDSTDVDIFNLSYGSLGYPRNVAQDDELLYAHGARRLRQGRGAVYVKAAGNGFGSCASALHPLNAEVGCVNTNSDPANNLPYPIVVGAFNADGRKASYSGAGPNLWISAPAGEFGESAPATITTEQAGGDRGLSLLLGDRIGATHNPDGDYINAFNGTSAAAPNVTGVVALLLDAAPELTWRDVKHILAGSARRIDPGIVSAQATFGGQTRTVRYRWATNGAGYRFHDWYGFGAVDADAALAAARTHAPDSLGRFRRSGWFEASAGRGRIPDNRGGGITRRIAVAGLPESASIEAVMVEVDLDHPFPHDLGMRLASPSGTPSTLNTPFNDALAVDFSTRRLRWRLLSNAFYGERPNGDWRLLVFDGAEHDTGTLEGWRIRFYYGEHPQEADSAANNQSDSAGT